jgi:hypothetical protein
MSQSLRPGDFLVFQLEAGFCMLRLLAIDQANSEKIWHVAAYDGFFIDVESAEKSAGDPKKLQYLKKHIALTNRAFESTQVARITSLPLIESEMEELEGWRRNNIHEISDRSVRLMLGLR